jgi:hypothetical protein
VSKARRLTVAGALVTAAGAALFVWLIARVGPDQILLGLRQVGWGLLVIIALAGLRFLLRAAAWSRSVEAPHHLPIRDAFAAVVAGDALGNLVPLGPVVSEPAKAALVRARVPLGAALTALAVENLLYTLSVAAMIAAGTIALLSRADLAAPIRGAGELAVGAMVVIYIGAVWLLWRRPALLSRAAALAARVLSSPRLDARIHKIRALEQNIYSFASRRRGALLPLCAAEVGFHALGVLEVHVTLWLMQGAPPPLITSFILETVNRLVTVVFKFVPMQVGVNEAGTGLTTQILGLGAAPGVTLSIVRKVRMLCWAALGTVLLVRRGVAPGDFPGRPANPPGASDRYTG